MDIISYIIGIICGIIMTVIINRKKKIYGIIDVDKKTGLCRIHISSNDLGNINVKHVLFVVNHDAELKSEIDDSRDEPFL